jgi:UDP-GlcNAc3NAcA epimerase
MKIISIVGARPNFIKIDPELKQEIWHTGQHWDYKMSQVFFDELNLPKPKVNLNCKSSELGKMIDKLFHRLGKEMPSLVIIYGDTNSSLAGALAAAYQNIPIAHIEAGLRSYNRNMPEEINRILIDQLAKIKLCPNNYAAKNLLAEGIKDDIHVVGDPMFDALIKFIPIKKTKNYQQYILVTLHRNFNVDNKDNLQTILEAIAESKEKFILPIHPRTKKNVKTFKLKIPSNVKVIEPQTYKHILSLISNAKKVITDSGGVQREAAWFNVPVILLRTETEWVDIISKGSGVLVGTNKEQIRLAIEQFTGTVTSPPEPGANKRIREIIYKYL